MVESAARRADTLSSQFAANLRVTAKRFSIRRGSRTVDTTDVENAHAWLTRPARKGSARDAIASVVVFLAAGIVAHGVNGLSAVPPVKGTWFVIVAGAAFATFAEVFRRWEYN